MRMALGIALLGGLGALCRYLADLAITKVAGRDLPFGTMGVNILGCTAAGVLLGATEATGPIWTTPPALGRAGACLTKPLPNPQAGLRNAVDPRSARRTQHMTMPPRSARRHRHVSSWCSDQMCSPPPQLQPRIL